jgi:hypothetical protein
MSPPNGKLLGWRFVCGRARSDGELHDDLLGGVAGLLWMGQPEGVLRLNLSLGVDDGAGLQEHGHRRLEGDQRQRHDDHAEPA